MDVCVPSLGHASTSAHALSPSGNVGPCTCCRASAPPPWARPVFRPSRVSLCLACLLGNATSGRMWRVCHHQCVIASLVHFSLSMPSPGRCRYGASPLGASFGEFQVGVAGACPQASSVLVTVLMMVHLERAPIWDGSDRAPPKDKHLVAVV